MRRRMLSYKRWVRNWAESLNVLATVHQLDHSSKGKTHDIIKRHVTEHSLKFPELHLGSDHILKLSETIWHNPWAIFGNALNQFRYIFIHHIWHICETSIASHEPCAMIHGSWLITRAFRPLPSTRPCIVIEQIAANVWEYECGAWPLVGEMLVLCVEMLGSVSMWQRCKHMHRAKLHWNQRKKFSHIWRIIAHRSILYDCHCKYLNDLWTILRSSL